MPIQDLPWVKLKFDIYLQSMDCQFGKNGNPEVAREHQILVVHRREESGKRACILHSW